MTNMEATETLECVRSQTQTIYDQTSGGMHEDAKCLIDALTAAIIALTNAPAETDGAVGAENKSKCQWCGGTDWTDNFSVLDEQFGQLVPHKLVKFCPFCGVKMDGMEQEDET